MIRYFSRAARFWRRSPDERRLLRGAALLFITAHVLLRLRTLEQVRSRLGKQARRSSARAMSADQLAWAIDAVNSNLPGHHSCLINALCCEAIAHNSGIPTELKIGAARDRERHRFHAWVEYRGVVLTGHDHAGFVPLA